MNRIKNMPTELLFR